MATEKVKAGSGAHALHGRRWDIRELDSVAFLLTGEKTLRGLYRLDFANGERYAGQSVNVATRFANHRRRWNDIVAFEFFPIPEGDLDAPEKMLIHTTEAEAGVRNIRDADHPGGEREMEVSVDEQVSVILPWERDRRVRPGESVVGKDAERFVELMSLEGYAYVHDIVGWYLYETCPDPVNTVRHLWTVSCMPSTAKSPLSRRALAVNMGNLEVLVVYQIMDEEAGEAGFYYLIQINTALFSIPDNSTLAEECVVDNFPGPYNEAQVRCWDFDIEGLEKLYETDPEDPFRKAFLDAAYELNVRLMRRGGTMFRRFHSDLLAADLIAGALQWRSEDPSVQP